MNKPILVIMAAGMGSRYGGLKQIDPVDEDGHIIIDFSLFDARRAGFERAIFIIKKENEDNDHKTAGRKETIFQHFANLVNQYADKEHNIAFYADQLCLTPNHLGTTIREVSGMTVQDWIHRRIIQQAKLFLMYSDMPVGEIAERLHFSTSSTFCKFFKKKTNMTPRKYREECEVH